MYLAGGLRSLLKLTEYKSPIQAIDEKEKEEEKIKGEFKIFARSFAPRKPSEPTQFETKANN